MVEWLLVGRGRRCLRQRNIRLTGKNMTDNEMISGLCDLGIDLYGYRIRASFDDGTLYSNFIIHRVSKAHCSCTYIVGTDYDYRESPILFRLVSCNFHIGLKARLCTINFLEQEVLQ